MIKNLFFILHFTKYGIIFIYFNLIKHNGTRSAELTHQQYCTPITIQIL